MLSTNTYILIFSLCLSLVRYGDAQDCPEIPVFSPDQNIDIELFYVPRQLKQLEDYLCAVIEEFGGLLTIKFRMGGLAKVLEDGTLSCGISDCSTDREKGCQSMLVANFHTCEPMGSYAPAEFDFCMLNFEADDTLIINGNLRVDYGIPEDALPAFVFSEFYNPCAPLTTYEEIKEYVCVLYNNLASPCTAPAV